MVNLLSLSPWMKPKLAALLGDSKDGRKQFHKFPPRNLQVILANDVDRFLIASDSENHVVVMLNTECIAQLVSQDCSISHLRQSLIRLEKYHFSTAIVNAGSRDEEKFASQGITFPVVIQCSQIKYIGGYGVDIINAPTDLNGDPDVANHLIGLNYSSLAERLGTRQFPTKGFLPDEGL